MSHLYIPAQYDAGNEVELFKRLNDEQIELCEKSLLMFFVNAWPVMEQRFELDMNWHMPLIAEHLEAVYHGQIEKLVINVPTRYLKSNFCTIAFPAWVWVQDARKKLLTWSYSMTLSTSLSWKRRQLIESEWFKTYWPAIQMSDDQNLKTEYANKSAAK